MDLSLALERNAVENDLTDAPALGQPVGVARRVVDASIEAGARRFFRGLVEGAKGAWRPGWRQVMIAMGGIRTSSSVNAIVVESKVGNVLLSPRALGAMVCLNKRVRPTAAWLSGGRG